MVKVHWHVFPVNQECIVLGVVIPTQLVTAPLVSTVQMDQIVQL